MYSLFQLPPNTELPCDLVDWLGAEDDEYRSLYDTRYAIVVSVVVL